jgi:hypothetical protein
MALLCLRDVMKLTEAFGFRLCCTGKSQSRIHQWAVGGGGHLEFKWIGLEFPAPIGRLGRGLSDWPIKGILVNLDRPSQPGPIPI